MNLLVDENISHAAGAFSGFGNISLMHGRKISNAALKDTDALIVRSITKVNEELLKDTPVKFVGTATIGTDHIDLDYLSRKGIYFSDAKGCNADAVAEFVFTSIFRLAVENGFSVKDKIIGVVGVGNIGSRIVKLANALGMKVLMNDPPRQRESGSAEFVALNEIYSADIITIHVPLNKEGIDKTVHLFNKDNLTLLKDNSIFINASRGQVVDNLALLKMLDKKNLNVVLDVWENEPRISLDLLKKVKFGSPHIAGYSLEGKINGTVMIYNALCKFLNKKPDWKLVLPAADNSLIEVSPDNNLNAVLNKIFTSIYNIKDDDDLMRKMFNMDNEEAGQYFDSLRKNYKLRREFTNYTVNLTKPEEELSRILKSFRFNLTS